MPAAAPLIQVVHDRRSGTAVLNQGNQSRIGFLHNCYNTSLGKFFQETIKKGILSMLKRVHDKEIPRYDKTPYEYDDPRLKNLDAVLKRAFAQHLNDNDAERKQEIGGMAADIVLFLMKEDIFYRMVIMRCIQHIAKDAIQHPDNYALTDYEEYLDDKFNGMGYCSTNAPHIVAFTFEKWKELRAAGLPSKPERPPGVRDRR